MSKSQGLNQLTIKQAAEKLDKREMSSVELTKACLEQIKEMDDKIHACLTVCEEEAIEQAKKADGRRQKGEKGILLGIPYLAKDNILFENIRTTAGSRILENYIAPYDATVIKKLREAGAVILGKTNMDEFGMGSSTENSAFGPTRNPHDLTRVPGGTSGGSAAAVAANFCVFALGSDTGGSIRQPASFCGVVGLKPTYGAVSRYGLIAFASSLDQIGPITKTVEDAEIVFDAIKGRDEMDSTSVKISKIQNTKYKIQDTKIGVPKEYFVKGIDPEVEKVIKNAIKQYEDLGAKIVELRLPHTEYALACYYIINPSEASANLARYDGIKYGFSKIQDTPKESKLPTGQAKYPEGKPSASYGAGKIQNLLDVYLQSRGEGFGEEVRRRIMLGTYALSAGYYDAYYLRAQKVRTKIRQDFEKAFEKVDLILTPVSPTVAFKLGEKIDDPLTMYLSDIFTVSVSLAGLPAISIPVGKDNNLPVGLQIIGNKFQEDEILKAAEFYG